MSSLRLPLSRLLPPSLPLPPPSLFSRSAHSRRQVKRLQGGALYRINKKNPPAPPPSQAKLDSLRAGLREEYAGYVKNDPASMERLSNNFVLPPPEAVAPTAEPGSPPFRVSRTRKEKGTGFYPVYAKLSNTRVCTEIKVSGDVLSFVSVSPRPQPARKLNCRVGEFAR